MNLTLIGHEDRYAVEQLQMALFPENPEGTAVSALSRGKTWLTATAKITLNGKTVSAARIRKNARLPPGVPFVALFYLATSTVRVSRITLTLI